MTEPRRTDDDGAGEPPETAGERAERDWLIARELDPTAPPPSADIARDYAQIEQLLAEAPVLDEDDSWHAAILQQAAALSQAAATAPETSPAGSSPAATAPPAPASPARPVPRTRPRWWQQPAFRWGLGGGGALAAAAAAGLALYPASATAMAIEVSSAPRAGVVRGGGDDHVVGDRIAVRLKASAGVLLVYQPDGGIVARCPGSSACMTRPDGTTVALLLEEPGDYNILGLAVSPSIATDGTRAEVEQRAREAGVELVKRRVEVR